MIIIKPRKCPHVRRMRVVSQKNEIRQTCKSTAYICIIAYCILNAFQLLCYFCEIKYILKVNTTWSSIVVVRGVIMTLTGQCTGRNNRFIWCEGIIQKRKALFFFFLFFSCVNKKQRS